MPEDQNSPQTSRPQTQRGAYGVPIAIVVGALLIGAAIIYTGNNRTAGNPIQNANNPTTQQETADIEVAPVTEKDHIRGNPNAPIMIVEYSDFECPFCKNFHATMQKIMETYGKDGQVAWVYRNFPLEQLHPNAPKVAAAAECVASLGGNDAFWKFADQVIGDRGVNEPTNITKLPEYAAASGVDKTKFTDCYENGTFNEKVQKDLEEALKTGARGTPYSILIVGDQQGVINGAQPYTTVKSMIDTVITQMGGSAKN